MQFKWRCHLSWGDTSPWQARDNFEAVSPNCIRGSMRQICQNCHEEWVSVFGFGCAEVIQWSHPSWVFTPNVHSPPHGLSLALENPSPSEPLLPNREVDVEDVVVVPDAQSAPDEVSVCPGVRAECGTDDVIGAPQEIPLTQNHPSKWFSNTFAFLILCSFHSFVSMLSIFVLYMLETILIMMVVLLFLHQPTWTQGLWALTV